MTVDERLELMDTVVSWRMRQIVKMWPGMTVEQAEELAYSRQPGLLHDAEKLLAKGCPAELAYRILRA